MNLEHLLKIILHNQNLWIKNPLVKTKIILFLKNYAFSLKSKLKKLKLGSVGFDIKQFFLGNVFLYDTIEMRYTKQDTTEEDEMKLENRLEAIKWKWDFQNVLAFLIIVVFIWLLIKSYLDITLKDLFPSFYDTERFDVLSSYAFKSIFEVKFFFSTSSWFLFVNQLFIKTLISSVTYLKIF